MKNIFKKIKLGKGFTLIEILVVVTIIGILATLVVVNYNTSRAKARDAKRKQDLSTYQTAIESYFDDYNVYPKGANAYQGLILLLGKESDQTVEYLQSFVDDPIVANPTLNPLTPKNQLWKLVDNREGNNYQIGVYFRYAYGGGGGIINNEYQSASYPTTAFEYILSAGIENSLDKVSVHDGGQNKYRYELGNARSDIVTCGIVATADDNLSNNAPYANIDCD